MPEASQGPEKANKVPHQGDHDRVAMLSLKADGTADQHQPEVIGDKGFALEAAKRQFAEQAVSAVDVAERGVSSGGAVTLVGQSDGSVKEEPANSDPDPATAELKKKQEAAAKSSEAAAESVVNGLFKG